MMTKTGDQESPQASASQVDQPSVQRAPPPETPAALQTRFRVIAAFWAVIILLGFPIWWKTTSIYRASLPIEEMVDWADGKACRPVFPLEIHLATPSMQYFEAQHLLRTTQHTLDDLNEFAAHHLRLKLTNGTTAVHNGDDSLENVQTPAEETADIALTVQLLPRDGIAGPWSELHAAATQLDIFYPPSQVPRLYGEEKATIAHILSGNTAGLDSTSPQLAEDIDRRLRRSMKYAETYHLSFSLFTPKSEPSSWDIEAALYANFAPTAPKPEYDESEAAWTLKKEDLSAFVNAAEWPLNPSIGNGPTINFILYVPDPSQSPLIVKENRASSWMVPQWGGVFLLNPPLSNTEQGLSNPSHLSQDSLGPAFMTFSHQLLTLLGTPSTPASLPLRLQTSIRIRAATLLLSASSTMGSLARLTESLPSIPIPATVATSVSTTISHLAASCAHLREGRFGAALASARVAETEAERSFFEKSMVGQVYFPDEHKVAVYLPLLGPIGVPLVVGLLKELKRIAARRKAKGAAS
ncbi:Phosphatidylinositol-glycan biosynthesis class S protein [Penicillium concentricum]|uniref:Phosphatidylinositol-glycan biosynthesis class S protein n=1 Tax=Penicillium concentricum TaxID=293559 RepID=A0A9W9VK98_9EURO|nr:Phosphatidylinositol-glycan biosynthesis class S protein [Penicillium concentricum]KAJ5385017.1 Phosphatidylinositol-glycan biosynthesis class S protein [Penicillium concentricum]